jgi:antitoxin YefM
MMTIMGAKEAGVKLDCLIDEMIETSEPIFITGKRSNAVLLSENDWHAIQETLHLLSISGLRESVRDGFAESIEDCSRELDW